MTTKVSNPLTIVAIFAALAEGFATYALVNVPHDMQMIFVYFVMAFPTLIVLIFFAVLNWNHTVLYAPSDFVDESMYLESIKLKSLKSEVINTLAIPSPDVPPLTPQQLENVSFKIDTAFTKAEDDNLRAALLAEFSSSGSTSESLKRRQQEIISFLELIGPTTVDELAKAMNLAIGTIRYHFQQLVIKGKVKYNPDDSTYDLVPISADVFIKHKD